MTVSLEIGFTKLSSFLMGCGVVQYETVPLCVIAQTDVADDSFCDCP